MAELRNRSLERGITLMEIIARTGSASLAELHRECGIPKSTIRRLLGTLVARRIVHRSLADRRYRSNVTMTTSFDAPVPKGTALYIDVAMPVLAELTRRIEWPSDAQIVDGGTMRIVDSTRPLSPFHLYRGVINRSINIYGSATGLAALAAMDEAQILAKIELTGDDPDFGLRRFRLTRARFFAEIERTRARGYGVRMLSYRGETLIDDGLSAIGLPIRRGDGEVHGAVSLLFPKHYASPEEIADRYLGEFSEAARRIERDLALYQSGPVGRKGP